MTEPRNRQINAPKRRKTLQTTAPDLLDLITHGAVFQSRHKSDVSLKEQLLDSFEVVATIATDGITEVRKL